MNKQLLTPEQLAEYLTKELRKVKDCQDCRIGGIKRLKKADTEGCNWSDSFIVSSGGIPEQYFRPYLEKIVREAKMKFNLEFIMRI